MNSEAIIAKLKAVPGNVGFYYKDLTTGETLGYNENEQFEAASVIKLPVYMVIMKLARCISLRTSRWWISRRCAG